MQSPGRPTPEKETLYQLSRRLGGPHGRSQGIRKIGIQSPDHLARSVSLYQLRYPGPPLIQYPNESVVLSHSRPGQAFRAQEGWGSRNFWKICKWKWEGCQPYAPATFTPRDIPGTDFCYRLSRKKKISTTQSGIVPATFQLVA